MGTPKTKTAFLIQQGLQWTVDIFDGKMMKSGKEWFIKILKEQTEYYYLCDTAIDDD